MGIVIAVFVILIMGIIITTKTTVDMWREKTDTSDSLAFKIVVTLIFIGLILGILVIVGKTADVLM